MGNRIVEIHRAEPAWVVGLIQEEAHEWRQRLHWERDCMVQAARSLARRRRLAGWLLMVDDEPAGKVLLGAHGDSRSLELPYMRAVHRQANRLESLLDRALSDLFAAGTPRRVECGFFPFGQQSPDAVFANHGFSFLPRHYMELSLAGRSTPDLSPAEQDAVLLEDWRTDAAEMAPLLHSAYEGSPDRRAAALYASQAGCAAYLESLMSREECGLFNASLSSLARDGAGRLLGFLLATCLSERVAHVAQIAVLPDWQGTGIGGALLDRYTRRAVQAGMSCSTLLVTGGNERARSWYERRGYRTTQPFASYWWDAG